MHRQKQQQLGGNGELRMVSTAHVYHVRCFISRLLALFVLESHSRTDCVLSCAPHPFIAA